MPLTIGAALFALIFGTLAVEVHNPYLIAALACGWVAWRTKNVLLTIVTGMGVWWGWQWAQQGWPCC